MKTFFNLSGVFLVSLLNALISLECLLNQYFESVISLCSITLLLTAYICVPLRILSLFGVDRHDCLSPSFSVLCQLWIELVLFQIAPHSVHPPQSGLSSRFLPSHLHCCYMLCNVCVFSSHHMAIQRKSFLGDICGDWLDNCIAPELFISDSVFPCFALSVSLLLSWLLYTYLG